MKKLTVLRVLCASALLSACAPLIVDESGRPIGFATRRPAAPAESLAATAQPDPYAGVDPHAPAVDPAMGMAAAEAPLVGWNGEVVEGEAGPTQEPPRHGIEPEGGGRMRIIELYQQVLDERDALRDELEALSAALEASQRERIELEEQTRALQSRIVALETAQESMQAENIDLAARLTTAQIRRLEAEKLLLETRIDDLRAQTAEPAEAMSDGRALPGNGS